VDVVSTLLAVDGTNLAHRAYHALAGTAMRTADGTPVWVLHGVAGLLVRALQAASPSSLVVAFDLPGGCPHRRELAPSYKAQRPAPADDLAVQLAALPAQLAAAGLAVRSAAGWEADDVIASVVAQAGAAGAGAAVVSSDKDLYQLVGAHVRVFNPAGHWVDAAAVHDRWSVPPARWVEFAALCGEQADNLPGVPGMGPKRSARLIAAFADVEDAIADPAAAAAAVGRAPSAALATHADVFRRNRTVGTLRGDLAVDVAGVRLRDVDGEGLRAAFDAAGASAAGRRLAAALAV
jgi:DNA polymerase-1